MPALDRYSRTISSLMIPPNTRYIRASKSLVEVLFRSPSGGLRKKGLRIFQNFENLCVKTLEGLRRRKKASKSTLKSLEISNNFNLLNLYKLLCKINIHCSKILFPTMERNSVMASVQQIHLLIANTRNL